MTDLDFARSQMALSLAFHIIFAVVGIGMPLLMVIAERLHQKKGDPVYLDLAKRWANGTAVLFAVGAVSGTVLSFELGLLWPVFMSYAGGIIGMPFSLEGFAFFTEAIFLGIYLYGWGRVPPLAHLLSGVMVALSGAASAVFVVTANAWMNNPTGFDLVDGRPVNVDPIAAMLNPSSAQQVIHMVLAAYIATGLVVAGIHAFYLLRDKENVFHRRAYGIALALVMICVPLQFVSGDYSAKVVSEQQPAKFAAMEAIFRTEPDNSLTIGGYPDEEAMETRYAIKIPGGLSLLLGDDAPVVGLEEFPREDWPPVAIVHWAFDLMIGCAMLMLLLVLYALWHRIRRKELPTGRRFLKAAVFASPLGFIAIEAGWVVTEVGRQPWIIYGLMRTKDAVTPMPGLVVPFIMFTLVYLLLSVVLVFVLRRQFRETMPR